MTQPMIMHMAWEGNLVKLSSLDKHLKLDILVSFDEEGLEHLRHLLIGHEDYRNRIHIGTTEYAVYEVMHMIFKELHPVTPRGEFGGNLTLREALGARPEDRYEDSPPVEYVPTEYKSKRCPCGRKR